MKASQTARNGPPDSGSLRARASILDGLIFLLSFAALAALLLVIYVGNATSPPPPSMEAVGGVGAAGGLLFVALAAWIDRHREPCRP